MTNAIGHTCPCCGGTWFLTPMSSWVAQLHAGRTNSDTSLLEKEEQKKDSLLGCGPCSPGLPRGLIALVIITLVLILVDQINSGKRFWISSPRKRRPFGNVLLFFIVYPALMSWWGQGLPQLDVISFYQIASERQPCLDKIILLKMNVRKKRSLKILSSRNRSEHAELFPWTLRKSWGYANRWIKIFWGLM